MTDYCVNDRSETAHRIGNPEPNLRERDQQSMKEEMQRAVGRVARVQAAATRWPFYVFMGGSMFCLLASAVCHLFTCHSQGLAILLMRVDYAGIAAMIATSFYPPIYYVFQCEPVWQWIYLGTITAMGVASVGVLFAPALQSSKYRVFRTVLFMSMGLFGVFPAIHGVISNWNEPQCHATIAYEASMAAFYVLGGIIYAVRIPERWRPGWFDLACHSHSLFHIFVVAGAVAHYQAALLFIEWRDAKGCH